MKRILSTIIILSIVIPNAIAQTNMDSNQKIGDSVSKLISMKYNESIADNNKNTGSFSNKKNRNDSILKNLLNSTSTLAHLCEFGKDEMSALNTFVVSILSPAPLNAPASTSSIMVYIQPEKKDSKIKDAVIYLFIDEECYGAGSATKGLLATIPHERMNDSFHQLLIVSSQLEDPVPLVVLYSSIVSFDIKNQFIFSSIINKHRISGLILNN